MRKGSSTSPKYCCTIPFPGPHQFIPVDNRDPAVLDLPVCMQDRRVLPLGEIHRVGHAQLFPEGLCARGHDKAVAKAAHRRDTRIFRIIKI